MLTCTSVLDCLRDKMPWTLAGTLRCFRWIAVTCTLPLYPHARTHETLHSLFIATFPFVLLCKRAAQCVCVCVCVHSMLTCTIVLDCGCDQMAVTLAGTL